MRRKILRKTLSIVGVIAMVLYLFPMAPFIPSPIPAKVARAATPGKFTNVNVTADNYTVSASTTLTISFTTANALNQYGDIIRFFWDDFGSATSASLDSITVNGSSFSGYYSTYTASSYFEIYLDTAISAGSDVVATVSGITHRSNVGRERVGIVSFSPNNGGTAYENCTDAGGNSQSYGDCAPFRVWLPVGTPEVKAQIRGPVGSADENNGINEAYTQIWGGSGDGYWDSSSADHNGFVYLSLIHI